MNSLVREWLARQCETTAGVTRGLVVVQQSQGESILLVARWPDGSEDVRPLVAVANAAFAQERAVVQGEPGGASRIAVPIRPSPRQAGVVVLETEKGGEGDVRDLVEEIRVGAGWLELLTEREAARQRLVAVLDWVGSALEHDRGSAAATAVATEMATRLGFDRVSLGFARRGRISIAALSHSASFDRRANLIRDLGRAMEEACDQDTTLVYPAPAGSPPRILREHQRLAEGYGARGVCSVPMAKGGRIVGAVTFERASDEPLPEEVMHLCEDAVSIVGPILELRRAGEVRPFERARDWLRQRAEKLFGPRHATLKLAAASAALLSLFFAFATANYRVVADATLEGRVQRAIVAGLDGFIAEAHARAGDVVRRGQVLGRLDERDLVLEQRKLAALREQYRKEYREAFAGHDRTRVNILSAKTAQAEAQLALVNEQLARTQLVAPFDGVVVRGDLSQSLGSPIERGDVLFEVAPLDGYRIILKVDERQISDIAVGTRGRLALAALPGDPLPLTVQRVTPVSVAEDGGNYFRVEARLERGAESLRPGMEGVAKIDVGRRSLLWIWTHDLIDWLRLWAWSWWL